MVRNKIARLAWVGVLVVSAFALGAYLKPSFNGGARSVRSLPAPRPMPPARPALPAWPPAGQQPRR